MDHEVVFVGDDFENQLQQHLVIPGPSGIRSRKRTYNASAVGQVQHAPQNLIHPQQILSDQIVVTDKNADVQSGSVIVDGQDVYFIQEIEDNTHSNVQVIQNEPRVLGCTPSYLPFYANKPDDELDEPHLEQQSENDDYYEVDPLELSDIWNDLITANQEVLILLELQDLKHHIVDARRIEDQMRNMVCEYCPRVLPNIRAWNHHVKKMHFQTELFECDSCDGKFKYYTRFKDHLNAHSGNRSYLCDECNHQYAFRIGFLVHKILDHIKMNGIYVCPKCNLDCKDAQSYKLHIAKHIDFGPAYCETEIAKTNPSAPAGSISTPSYICPIYTPAAAPSRYMNVFESFSQKQHQVRNKGKESSAYKKRKLEVVTSYEID